MCETNDPFTSTAALCTNGKIGDGWDCTGHAHYGSQHIRCTDPSHATSPELVIKIPASGLTLPLDMSSAVYGDLTGQRWTCSA